jgi:hypothetical protein
MWDLPRLAGVALLICASGCSNTIGACKEGTRLDVAGVCAAPLEGGSAAFAECVRIALGSSSGQGPLSEERLTAAAQMEVIAQCAKLSAPDKPGAR